MNKIYLVEIRKNKLINNSKDFIECMNVFVASTPEKALTFCSEATDYHDHTPLTPWWFVISEEVIDSDTAPSKIVAICDWNGKKLDEQPVYGYNQLVNKAG
jgi:hypothetical protein